MHAAGPSGFVLKGMDFITGHVMEGETALSLSRYGQDIAPHHENKMILNDKNWNNPPGELFI